MIMNSIAYILLVTFAGASITFIVHHIARKLRDIVAIAVTAFGLFYVIRSLSENTKIIIRIADFNLIWGGTAYSNLFAVLVAVLGFLVVLYAHDFMANKDRLGYFYMNFLLVLGGMYGIVFSQDLVSLFFFWEVMTWSSFLLVIYCCKEAQPIGLKYFVFSAIGAYSLLIAIVMLYSQIGNLELSSIIENFSSISSSNQIIISVLFLVGFGVKSAVMPLHVWAPDSYSISPSPFTALFSGALSKMGIYGIGLVLFKLASHSGYFSYVQIILAWIGGITALLGTFYAIFQTDAKKLLAYSSISQLGYIIIGLAVGTPLSIAAALFLVILHGAFKAMLFMAVGAVYLRTGTTDMDSVTGLIRKMPYSFVTVLFGIITVSGVPPLGGFAAKWMLYESLIQSKHYFLVIVVFAASTAAFLYLYRLIFSLFLGQEEKEWANVKEAPLLMLIPMLFLSAFVLIVGIFPGLILDPISQAMQYLGNYSFKYETSVLFNDWGNQVNMQTVINVIGAVFLIAGLFVTFKGLKKTRYVTTKDIHTSGEIPKENENLTYAVDFYKPFERAIAPILKASIDKVYTVIANNLEQAFDFLRYVYTGNGQTYAMYVVLFLSLLILFAELIFGIKL